MYNFYIEQKRQEELESKKRAETELHKQQLKRKKRLPQLVENYEARIKNFLYEMVEHPILIKDKKEKNTSTRQDLLFEESNKILSKKGFVFNHFPTSPDDVSQTKTKHSKRHKPNDNDYYEYTHSPHNTESIQQPIMRFKPRTDLERIYDTLMQISPFTNANAKTLVDNQLTDMGICKVTRNKRSTTSSKGNNNTHNNNNNVIRGDTGDDDDNNTESDNDSDSNNSSLAQKKRKRKVTISTLGGSTTNNNANAFMPGGSGSSGNDKSKQSNIKGRVDNSNAKKIHGDLHNKTYFKAVENYSLFKNSFFIPEKKQIYQQTSSPFKQTHRNDNYRNNKKNFNELQLKRHLKPNSTLHYNALTNTIDIAKTISSFRHPGITPLYMSNDQQSSITSPVELIKMLNTNNGKKEKENNLLKSLEHVDLFTQSLKESQIKKHNDHNNKFEKVKQLAFPPRKQSCGELPEFMFKNVFGSGSSSGERNSIFYSTLTNSKDDSIKKQEEKVVIDGVVYNKNDLEKLSKKVLEKCNFRHLKYGNEFKGENNNIYYKAGKGKLMFTKGMTISEFEQKYNL